MQANFQRAVLSAVLGVLVSACPGSSDSPTIPVTYPAIPVTSPTWSSQDAGMGYAASSAPDAARLYQEPPRPPTYPWYCFRSAYYDNIELYLELLLHGDGTFRLCSRTLADCEANRGKFTQLLEDKGLRQDLRECRFLQRVECSTVASSSSPELQVCAEIEEDCYQITSGLHKNGYTLKKFCKSTE